MQYFKEEFLYRRWKGFKIHSKRVKLKLHSKRVKIKLHSKRVQLEQIRPSRNVLPELDKYEDKVNQIIDDLNYKILENLKTTLKTSEVKYVHSKYRFEVEVPDNIKVKCVASQYSNTTVSSLVSQYSNTTISFLSLVVLKYDCKFQLPSSFEITSTRKGFVRFHSPEIREAVSSLETSEQNYKDSLYPFLSVVFRNFEKNVKIFKNYTRCLASIDCLQSIAKVVQTTLETSEDENYTRNE